MLEYDVLKLRQVVIQKGEQAFPKGDEGLLSKCWLYLYHLQKDLADRQGY
jgi:hypothetical protein